MGGEPVGREIASATGALDAEPGERVCRDDAVAAGVVEHRSQRRELAAVLQCPASRLFDGDGVDSTLPVLIGERFHALGVVLVSACPWSRVLGRPATCE